ncbi:sterol 3beta-glucosyltransferase [Exophiala viscosa]|uniref:sterol 3beta-glucosyltransferase n=1 Tax=Exophiala viscosa TaxID=2486360 RepID=UPI00219D83CB|nr:sterol 3beta-glucosyltransferase [Exophiala viscosa]
MSASDTPPPEPLPHEVVGLPVQIIREAEAIAAANQEEDRTTQKKTDASSAPENRTRHHGGVSSNLDDVPAPAYNGADYGQLDISQNGMDTGARLGSDGRVNIKINQRSKKLTNLLLPALRHQLELQRKKAEGEPPIPEGLGDTEGLPPPPMNIVIQIVGSRGDVQPFVALGQVLKNKYKHRVRIATHPTFKDFVTENGLEFFSIGGDPAELMAFMVKNPGLMPGMDSLKSGDVGKRRKGIYEIITGCWRSTIEAGDGTGVQLTDDARSFDSAISFGTDPTMRPFVADAIIANPPSFAHVHIAEKLGIPLHLMFTMPWSPTQSFPHPLANIVSSNADANMANFVTYALVDMLTWQGLGDVINRFRERSLNLEPISIMWAPGMVSRLHIPWTYCWSPALIPKPADWGNYIDISGFFFLNLSTNYTPAPDLADFLAAGPPPVYIGFGSIVVDDPNAMTKMIFEAVKKTGQRALVSKGWGGLGADQLGIPEGVFMLGNIPHDWLFNHVSCVVHHGGAGTTAAGILAGRPTVVVPFFGDQPFWGAMTAKAGAGPKPIPYKQLTADKLAAQIMDALKPESLERAKELSMKIRSEDGTEAGAQSFHKQLHLPDIRCSLDPRRTAVWRIKRTDIRLSPLAAVVLGSEGLLDFSDLKLYRAREYETEDGPWEPISGGAAALIGTIGNLSMGVADFPVEIFNSLKTAHGDLKDLHEREQQRKHSAGPGTPLQPQLSQETIPDDSAERRVSADAGLEPKQSHERGRSQSPSGPAILSHERVESPTFSEPSTGAPTLATTTSQSRPSAMSSVVSPDGSKRSHSHHRRWSHHRSHSRSGSGSRKPHHRDHSPACEEVGQISLETALSGAKAVGKIVSAGVKSPMDFTLSLAKGFHNAPKLYGDETVRKSEKITDLQSGLRAAGREFTYGFYDGVTGLVTQPLAGAKKEGAAGFFKGAAKGFGGLILKPGAGIWGLPGYTAKGIYAEVAKHFGSSVQNYIIAARTAQGFEDWKNSTPEERDAIISAWKDNKVEEKKRGQLYGSERKEAIESHILTKTHSDSVELVHGFKNTRHLSWDERKALAERRDQLKKEQKELERREREVKMEEARRNGNGNGKAKVKSRCRFCPFDHDSNHHLDHTRSFSSISSSLEYSKTHSPDDDSSLQDYEHAITMAVTESSKGDPDEDAIIERALRASLKELHNAGHNGNGKDHNDDAYKKALRASLREFKRAQADHQKRRESQETGVISTVAEQDEEDADEDEEHRNQLKKVLTRSLEEYKASQAAKSQPILMDSAENNDSGIDTDYDHDKDFHRAMEESKRLHDENQAKHAELAKREEALKSATVTNGLGAEEDEKLKRAITESEQHEKARQEDLTKQRTEEEIVLDYIKKQSLREEELRKQRLAEHEQA